jgi:hypothetical protein
MRQSRCLFVSISLISTFELDDKFLCNCESHATGDQTSAVTFNSVQLVITTCLAREPVTRE